MYSLNSTTRSTVLRLQPQVQLCELMAFTFQQDAFRTILSRGGLAWAKEMVSTLPPEQVDSFIDQQVAKYSVRNAIAGNILGALSNGDHHWPLKAWTRLQEVSFASYSAT